ncbi:MFS transporter [Pseudomonas lalucatii]|uniref:MFS transporter n=1 Tax=Pseudomonas lalucatii TaxID=1424203 RepID=A0ABS5Q561_9PSED|nr:MFS transporter [Pseudomonas lalucatii]MBS7663688.1 MFS transporter [Pseudomonas lalucatii]
MKDRLLKQIPATSTLAYCLLAFIAMAGLAYINFLPGVVNALAGGIGFSDAQAGQIVALNGYGGLLGSAVAILLIRRVQWRYAMMIFLALLTIVDLSTAWVENYPILLGWRFGAGVLGGLCVGIGFAVLARLNNPDRAFGLLLFVQFSLGSVVVYLLPGLETSLGTHAVFYVMATLAFLSLVFLPFLPALPANSTSAAPAGPLPANAVLLLSAILGYQAAASGIWAYVGLIGRDAGLAAEPVSQYIAATGLLGLLGAMLPVIRSNRSGRLYWVIAGMAMSIAGAVLLSYARYTALYVVAMALLFFAWPAVQSFLLAVSADMDNTGRLSAVAGLAAYAGLASGPLFAASLLDSGSFAVVLYNCAATFFVSFLLLFRPVQAKESLLGAVSLSQQLATSQSADSSNA